MDLFQKCRDFTRADEVKAAGLYPYFRAVEENEGPVVTLEGRPVIMAGSNNYLGLTSDPRVKKAAIDAIERYGTGCSGSRYLTGTINLHNELEEKLAAFLGYESVLLFSTGYQTALGTVSASPNDTLSPPSRSTEETPVPAATSIAGCGSDGTVVPVEFANPHAATEPSARSPTR